MKRFLFVNVEKEPPFATSMMGEKPIEYGTTVVDNVLAEIQEAEKQQDYSTDGLLFTSQTLTRLDYLKIKEKNYAPYWTVTPFGRKSTSLTFGLTKTIALLLHQM